MANRLPQIVKALDRALDLLEAEMADLRRDGKARDSAEYTTLRDAALAVERCANGAEAVNEIRKRGL